MPGNVSGKAQHPGMTLEVKGHPAPWSFKNVKTFEHHVKLTNKWPHDLIDIEVYVRCNPRVAVIAATKPTSRRGIIKIAIILNKTSEQIYCELQPNNKTRLGNANINTFVAFGDPNYKSGLNAASAPSRPPHKFSVSYNQHDSLPAFRGLL